MLLLPAPKPLLMLPAPQPMKALPAVASRKVRVFSFGGGVQSHAVLALQIAGKLHQPYDVFVFANVGHDSENPATLEYIERYTKPLCERHGIKFVEVQKTRKDGQKETLLGRLYSTERSVPIPARMGGNGAPGNRSCTADFKIEVLDKWVRENGYSHAIIGLGISLDEFHRARSETWHSEQDGRPLRFQRRREHPLIEMRLKRQDCLRIISEAGLPQPPKSSCWFCPFHKRGEWIEMKRERPELFNKAVALERHINDKRELVFAQDKLYLHSSLMPLDRAVGDQLPLFSDEIMDTCETGYCVT